MGTRADYYVGRGDDAKWLCSTAWDGYPDGIDDAVLDAATEPGFISALSAFVEKRDDVTKPEQGWPWPWDNSQTTDYAYAFDGGQVWISCFGSSWVALNEWRRRAEVSDAWDYDAQPDGPPEIFDDAKVDFPDMSDIKNVTHGARSGLILLGIPHD